MESQILSLSLDESILTWGLLFLERLSTALLLSCNKKGFLHLGCKCLSDFFKLIK